MIPFVLITNSIVVKIHDIFSDFRSIIGQKNILCLSGVKQGCRNDFLHGGGGGGGGGQIQIFWRFTSQSETSRRAPI